MNKVKYCFLLCVFLLMIVSGCDLKKGLEPVSSVSSTEEMKQDEEEKILEEDIDKILSIMSLEDKVAQLFITVPESFLGSGTVTSAGTAMQQEITKIPIGGLIYLSQNLQSEEQVKSMLSEIQQYSIERTGLPIFQCLDEEGGTVTRISGSGRFQVPDIGNMSEIGQTENPDNAYQVGIQMGTYLSELGFNVDFAPDADVLSNEKNNVVKYRSFGNNPEMVYTMAKSLSDGLHACGVCSTFKHFPGHGATEADTHLGYAYTNKTLDELQQCELIPFQKCIDENSSEFIMVSHISVPNVTGDYTPSSISDIVVQKILREQMGYDGIVITDSIDMGAVSSSFSVAQASVKALNAGVDIILTASGFQSAYQEVLTAVSDGRLSEDRINESVERILRVKLKLKEQIYSCASEYTQLE